MKTVCYVISERGHIEFHQEIGIESAAERGAAHPVRLTGAERCARRVRLGFAHLAQQRPVADRHIRHIRLSVCGVGLGIRHLFQPESLHFRGMGETERHPVL